MIDLAAIRPLLVEAKASEAVAAVDRFDKVNALALAIGEAGNAAHQAPHLARRRHHDLVAADVAQGRQPDDVRLWADVVAADVERERAQARYAAALDGLKRARQAAEAAVAASAAAVLPWLAANRPEPSKRVPPDHPTARAKAWTELYRAIRWPPLSTMPAADSGEVYERYTRWWPLIADAADYTQHRTDRVEWDRFAWAELAAGRYKLDAGVLTFEREWRPERYAFGQRPLRPVVLLDPRGERVGASFEGQSSAVKVVVAGPVRN